MLSPAVIGTTSAFCSGLLGLWLVRYRALGPQTLKGAAVGCVVAMALLTAVGPAMRWVVASSGGAAALLAVADPVFVFAFWSGGMLLRALVRGPRTS